MLCCTFLKVTRRVIPKPKAYVSYSCMKLEFLGFARPGEGGLAAEEGSVDRSIEKNEEFGFNAQLNGNRRSIVMGKNHELWEDFGGPG